jgi:hypothetical protein
MSSQMKRFSWEDPTSTRNGVSQSRRHSCGTAKFYHRQQLVSGDPRIRIVGILILTKLETAQMKAGGARPTAPKKFLFPIKRPCTPQANILACGHRGR